MDSVWLAMPSGTKILFPVARTEAELVTGLADRDHIGPGMVLDFGTLTRRALTMARVRVPLDVALLNDAGQMLASWENLIPGTLLLPPVPYRYALELPAGDLRRHRLV